MAAVKRRKHKQLRLDRASVLCTFFSKWLLPQESCQWRSWFLVTDLSALSACLSAPVALSVAVWKARIAQKQKHSPPPNLEPQRLQFRGCGLTSTQCFLATNLSRWAPAISLLPHNAMRVARPAPLMVTQGVVFTCECGLQNPSQGFDCSAAPRPKTCGCCWWASPLADSDGKEPTTSPLSSVDRACVIAFAD